MPLSVIKDSSFSEEKEAKRLLSDSIRVGSAMSKSFLLLFFKKEDSLFL